MKQRDITIAGRSRVVTPSARSQIVCVISIGCGIIKIKLEPNTGHVRPIGIDKQTKATQMGRVIEAMIRKHPRVQHLDLDDPCGPIVTLRKGWSFDPMCDNRVLGEDTATQLLKSIRTLAKPFAGPYDPD